MSEGKKEYRVAEQPNRITIELRNGENGDLWYPCDENGDMTNNNDWIIEYKSVSRALKIIQRFPNGTIYHYPPVESPEKVRRFDGR